MLMRRLAGGLLAAVAMVAVAGVRPAAADVLKADDLVAISGDSITEQKDYSVDMEAYLLMCREQGPVKAVQFGWGGDSMGWLWGRGGPKDMLAFHPTVMTTCFGMNDGGYKPVTEETTRKYRDGMDRLVKTLKQGGVRLVIVGSPGVVDSESFHNNPADATMYNQTLASLRDVAREVAKENDCAFADVHSVMMDAMTKAKAKYGPKYLVAGVDGVHPGSNGHLVMAYAFLKAMGCDGAIGTITVDMGANSATATEGHKVLSAKDGAVEVESSRYPYCLSGKAGEANGTAGMVEFFPFNQDLNRFELVVKNASSERVRVTWGTTSKEFAAADLAKGVNLAAEFGTNPFSEPFGKLREAIRKKQEYETMVYKTAQATFPGVIQEIDPQAAGSLDRVLAALIKKDGMMADDLKTKVTPVTHVIRVEAVK